MAVIWPYSQSKGTLSVLLRQLKGQVKVHFVGSSAFSVSKANIKTDDEVTLSLDGADWVEDITPGRGIGWGIKFSEKLIVQV